MECTPKTCLKKTLCMVVLCNEYRSTRKYHVKRRKCEYLWNLPFCSYQTVGIWTIIAHVTKITVFYTILKTSYVMNTRVILVHLTSNNKFKTTKHFQMAEYWIFCQNSKFHLPHWSQTQGWRSNEAAHCHHFKTQEYTVYLLVGCAFWGFWQVCSLCALHFFLSSTRFFFLKQWNHIEVLIFHITIFLEDI